MSNLNINIELSNLEQLVNIRDKYTDKYSKVPTRNVDAVKLLGITEGRLLSAQQVLTLPKVKERYQSLLNYLKQNKTAILTVALRESWADIINYSQSFGEVMAVTRNDACIHEKICRYGSCLNYGNPRTIGAISGELNLQLSYEHWYSGFFVIENKGGCFVKSLQFFNDIGVPIHKVYIREKLNDDIYDEFLAAFAKEQYSDDSKLIEVIKFHETPKHPYLNVVKESKLDLHAFRRSWSEMREDLDLSRVLIEFEVGRLQAYRLVGSDYALKIDKDAVYDILKGAGDHRIRLAVSVGNDGVMQTHQGLIYQITSMGDWISILDGDFNLHIREAMVHSAWIINKPSIDGIQSSLELFDRNGRCVAIVSAAQDSVESSQCQWRKLLTQMGVENCI